MAYSRSTSLVNMQGMGVSLADILEGGEISIFTGTAPAATAAYTGTLLVTCTNTSGARTADTMATAYLTFSGGAAGNTCTNITVAGFEILGATITWVTSDAVTAGLVATQINKFTRTPIKCWAYSDGAGNVTVYMCPGHGATMNTQVVAVTVAGGGFACAINGASADQMGVGAGGSTAGITSVNGITFGEISAGLLTVNCTMSGTPVATGAAGYFRFEGCTTPTGTSAADTVGTAPRYRIQGTCGLSSADMIFSGTTTITSGVTHTITSGSFTIPVS